MSITVSPDGTITGGANSGSNDVVDYRGNATPVQVTFSPTLYAGTVSRSGTTINFTGIRGVLGSDGADTITGTTYTGNAAFTILLEGAAGNDTIDGRNNTQNQVNYQFAPSAIVATLAIATDGSGNTSGTVNDGYGTTDTVLNVARIRGSSHNDTITGGGGGEQFVGSLGSDSYDGGGGLNALRYDSSDFQGGQRSVTVVIGSDGATITKKIVSTGATFGTDAARNITQFRGSDAGDVFIGSDDPSRTGTYEFRGQAGNDTIKGWGLTINQASYANASGAVLVDLAAGTAQDGQGGTDTLIGVVAVGGSSNADTLLGSAGNDLFYATPGNDTIDGRGGNDTALFGAARSHYSASLANGVVTLTGDGTAGSSTYTLTNVEQFRFADQTLSLAGLLGITVSPDGTITGGANSGSNDVVDYRGNATPVQVTFSPTLYAGTVSRSGTTINFTGIRGVLGSDGADTITGTTYTGNAAFTILLEGAAGNDTIDGRNNTQNQVNYQFAPSAIVATLAIATDGSGNTSGTVNDGYGTTDTVLNVARIRGSDHNDTITGGSGGEQFVGSLGSDSYDGGGGLNALRYDSSDFQGGQRSVTVVIGSDGATITKKIVSTGATFGTDAARNITQFRGSDAGDVFIGSDDPSRTGTYEFRGQAGNDTIKGWGLTINQASYANASGAVLVDLAAGTAQDGQGGTDTLIGVVAVGGSSNADTLLGSAGNDLFYATPGNDTIDGRGGNDTALFGAARSHYSASLANGVVTLTGDGTAGSSTYTLTNVEQFRFADQTFSLAGLLGEATPPVTPPVTPPTPNVETGGTGASLATTTDTAAAQSAANQAVETLPATTNAAAVREAVGSYLGALPTGTSVNVSTFTPTPGAGEIRIEGPTNGTQSVVVLDATAVPPGTPITVNNVGFIVLSGPASLVGGEGSQVVFGDDDAQSMVLGADDDTLHGGGGNDVVGSREGNDLLYGDAGDDTVFGGVGNDSLFGGTDRDLILGNQDNDLIYGNQGADSLYGGQGDDRAFGGQGDDLLFGNLGSDVLFGNLGSDIIYGNQGNDVIYGNQGADILFGGQGDDLLYGGQDADTLVGGIGDDILIGGLGADLYRFDLSSARDLVLGFNQADGDRIALGGQTYTVSSAQNGDALLLLSGGGVVDLAGIRADQVNASYFAA